jgi:hypothetical protein
VSKGVEVILIVDACRSGDVPGVRSGIGNPYQSVIEEPAGEVLLLSAGPNQFALEDRRWGGGHGGFTWYLMKGLSGEADVDGDGNVSLFEIESYTKMKVIGDTKQMGAAQTPYVCCNNKFDCVLSKKDEWFSRRVREEESGNTKVGLTALAARDALEKAMFEKEELKQEYFALKKACKEKRYLGKVSAWDIWERCKKKYTEQEVEPLRMYLMGALAAEGQKAINEEMNVSFENSPSYNYYKERRQWVDAAIILQKSPDEIIGINALRDFIKALELNNSVTNAFPILDTFIYTFENEVYRSKTIKPYDEADSIFKTLEKSFGKSAVFYFILQDYLRNRQNYYLEDRSAERKKHLQKAMQLAPFWAKPLSMAIVFKIFSEDEIESILKERILADPNNADHYYLSFVQKSFSLPIKRGQALEDLERTFYLRPSTELMGKLIQEKFLNFLLPIEHMMFSEFDQIYTPSKEDWVSFEKIMNHYYNGTYHASECKSDTNSVIRKLIPRITAFAVRCGHADIAKHWLAMEEKVCPSYDAKLCLSILAKYVDKNTTRAHQYDLEAIKINTGQESMLNYYGAEKDKIPTKIRKRALYQSVKCFNLVLFAQDDWMMEEKKAMDTLSAFGSECFKLAFAFRFLCNKHLKTGKSNFENWNDLMDELRRVDRPELMLLASSSARFYDVLDSLTIFLRDDQLSSYLGQNPIVDVPLQVMDCAQRRDTLNADRVLREAYKSLGNNLMNLANVLVISKSNVMYRNTSFFQDSLAQPKSEMDHLVLFQLFYNWGLEKEAFEVFNSFNWNDKGSINPVVLATLVNQCSFFEDANLTEEMMNILIPYAFQSESQDYSTAISYIHAYFFLKTKRGDDRRNSAAYKNLLTKFVVQ